MFAMEHQHGFIAKPLIGVMHHKTVDSGKFRAFVGVLFSEFRERARAQAKVGTARGYNSRCGHTDYQHQLDEFHRDPRMLLLLSFIIVTDFHTLPQL
jgi:hypothetical protein